MSDDPDARMEAAEPPDEAVLEAPEIARPAGKRPYHEPIAPELVDDLHLAIGKGLALVEVSAGSLAEHVVDALARYVDDLLSGARTAPTDASDAALALACLYGQAVCKKFAWGWAHVRRTRSPGILVISVDGRYAMGPRAVIDRALGGDGGRAVREHFALLASPQRLPASEPGRYQRV